MTGRFAVASTPDTNQRSRRHPGQADRTHQSVPVLGLPIDHPHVLDPAEQQKRQRAGSAGEGASCRPRARWPSQRQPCPRRSQERRPRISEGNLASEFPNLASMRCSSRFPWGVVTPSPLHNTPPLGEMPQEPHLVLAMSTGMEAAVVTNPLIMLAQKWHRMLS